MQEILKDIVEEVGHLAHPKAFISNISLDAILGGL